jgi:N-acetyltransferase
MSDKIILTPIVLEGPGVRLEPLSLAHIPRLCEIGLDPEIWQSTTSLVRNADEMKIYVKTALRWQAEGTALPFATIDKSSGKIAGSTRFANIDRSHRRLEIGWTWLGLNWQRTHVNTEAKYLMLKHAFEGLGCIRVEFKTDVLNQRSRAALNRIRAKEEGVLRKHMITASGRFRDTVYYSILDTEWPDVKAELEKRMAKSS